MLYQIELCPCAEQKAREQLWVFKYLKPDNLLMKAYREAREENDYTAMKRATNERRALGAQYRKEAIKEYGRLCAMLGPEEGGFYSAPYCRDCLTKIIAGLPND